MVLWTLIYKHYKKKYPCKLLHQFFYSLPANPHIVNMTQEFYASRAPMTSYNPSPGRSHIHMRTSLAMADEQKLVVCAVDLHVCEQQYIFYFM